MLVNPAIQIPAQMLPNQVSPSFFAAPTEVTLGRIPFSIAPPPIAAPNVGDQPRPRQPVSVSTPSDATHASSRPSLSLTASVLSPVTMQTQASVPFLAQMLSQGIWSAQTGEPALTSAAVPVVAENFRAARSPALQERPILSAENANAHSIYDDDHAEALRVQTASREQAPLTQGMTAAREPAQASSMPRPVLRDATAPLRRSEALPRGVFEEDIDLASEERQYRLLPDPFGVASRAYRSAALRNEELGKPRGPVVPF